MSSEPQATRDDHWRKCFQGVWLAAALLLMWGERIRIQRLTEDGQPAVQWLFQWDMETTLPCIVILALPLLIHLFPARRLPTRQRLAGHETDPFVGRPDDVSHSRTSVAWGWLLVMSLSLASSAAVGWRTVELQTPDGIVSVRMVDLPPAYHDEYSYLLLARTFLSGRLSWPAAPVRPDLFHQFHVLNHHRTVSRYFPWTGLWLMPFVACSVPVYGHWLAGALAAGFFYLALAACTRLSTALTAGLLMAVSPGLAIFSNLLLAHHPTLLALSIFTWSFLRMVQNHSLTAAFVAGIGLSLAMLGRPMTAAGFGLPFGVWLLMLFVRQRLPVRLTIGFAVPLLAAFSTLAVLNDAATGSWRRSAYQEYTELFTPRHRYGFNNAVQRVSAQPPRVLIPPAVKSYDQWAQNLTPREAIRNVGARLIASAVWSLGIAPLAMFAILLLPRLLSIRTDGSAGTDLVLLRVFLAAIISLHLAHLPYWFDGIMHWHYVFETAPLLLILTAAGLTAGFRILSQVTRPVVAGGWLLALVFCSLTPDWVALPVYGNVSKVSAAASELAYSKTRMELFRQLTERSNIQKPALILVDESGSDPQLSFIVNPPDYTADVLVCRLPGTDSELAELQSSFPLRHCYVFEPLTFALRAAETSTPDHEPNN
ncbi:MAG: hypothetical protein R3C49_16840 [Planctomycetaceae bacterium]